MLSAATALLADNGWTNHMWGSGWGLWMGLGMVVFWGAIIWLVVSFTRVGDARGRDKERDQLAGAQALLAERLARGEIEPNEYRDRLNSLQ